MRRHPPLLPICVACFVLGAADMVLFEAPVARIVGVALLFAFIVSGVFLVADPDWLASDEEA